MAGRCCGRQWDIVFCLNSCRRCLLPGDRQFQNVILLSISFMLIFTAFQTLTNIEETVVKSVARQDPSFTGDGYTSLAIIYTVFAISNWIVPPIVALIKAKWTMILGASFYVLFIASFLYPKTWLLYTMSCLIGFGGAFLWTAQGNYLTLSSSSETMSRNSGVFWAILQCSMFFGNGFVFWMFEGQTDIDKPTQIAVFSTLTAVGCLGILTLLCLRTPDEVNGSRGNTSPVLRQLADLPPHNENPVTGSDPDISSSSSTPEHQPPPPTFTSDQSASVAVRKTISLVKDPDILLLSFLFVYTGFELSFQSGIYSTCIGNTKAFGEEAKRLVGLCGIMVGAGEVAGGALFGLLGTQTTRHGRDPVVLLGFLAHTLAFYLIFLSLPFDSPLRQTYGDTYIGHGAGVVVVMLCAFLLGFGDACFSTQIYSIIGALWPHDSSPPFSIFKFMQSSAAAISFSCSVAATLTVQLVVLQVICVLGTCAFFLVEWNIARNRVEEENRLLISSEEDQENYG